MKSNSERTVWAIVLIVTVAISGIIITNGLNVNITIDNEIILRDILLDNFSFNLEVDGKILTITLDEFSIGEITIGSGAV